jgi:hypothetical protein
VVEGGTVRVQLKTLAIKRLIDEREGGVVDSRGCARGGSIAHVALGKCADATRMRGDSTALIL